MKAHSLGAPVSDPARGILHSTRRRVGDRRSGISNAPIGAAFLPWHRHGWLFFRTQAERPMKGKPKIGTSSELRFVVEPRHAIDFADGGMPAVLSTPHLVGFLERTAREALAPLLEDNERSVGVEIEIRHLAPTPVGQNVTCVARIVHADGTQITFQVKARD